MKLSKESIDSARGMKGFPIGTDEDIISLSDEPWYTACPNMNINEFIEANSKEYIEDEDTYKMEPFAFDVSVGKNDPIYNAHSYHTKVPYKAIMRYILHYTKPGDLVFDGFCGTGMSGVAALKCKCDDPELIMEIEKQQPNVSWGARKAVLNDLAPIATFIASNFTSSINTNDLEKETQKIIDECDSELGWMFETEHTEENQISLSRNKGIVNYFLWSDVLNCPHCGFEFSFWDVAVDYDNKIIKDDFVCPSCSMKLKKKECTKAFKMVYDEKLEKTIEMQKQVPTLINYTYAGRKYTKRPDKSDYELVEKIESMKTKYWYPTDRMCEGGESRRNDKYGITHVHHFFTKRNLVYLSALYEKIQYSKFKKELLFIFTASNQRANKTNRFRFGGTGNLSGTLYIPSLQFERCANLLFLSKMKDIIKQKNEIQENADVCITTGSLTGISNIKDNSFDYIFTDPPFGDNLSYSELSFIWEAWLKVKTNNKFEAIINKSQKKALLEYQDLMTESFCQCYRVLKPNRWMTVEFHNSKNSVWNAIQESLIRAGFIIADVRILDKKQESFKQLTSSSAVKQDLVISAYKPKESFRKNFLANAGKEETAWDFVKQHLENLPIVVTNGNKIEIVSERQAFLLFDRMVAYHIINGLPIPVDSTEFYQGLREKYIQRDNMYFLSDQVNEYDVARIKNDIEPIQYELFVTNEKSAIAWLYQQLDVEQSYADIQPKFMQEIKSIDKYEQMPELSILLEENFLQGDNGKWYIPDITKEGDIKKLREKKLYKEFEEYLTIKGKLKTFRTEAIRVGFAKLWEDANYKLIVETAERLPESVVQEDDKLLMYYDISLGRI